MEKEIHPNLFDFMSVSSTTKLSEAVAFFDKFLSDSNTSLADYLSNSLNRERVNASWVFIFYMTLSHGTQEDIKKVKEINERIPKLAEKLGYATAKYDGKVNEKTPPKEAIETLKCEFSQKAGVAPTQFMFLEKIETLLNSGLLEELEGKQSFKKLLRKKKKTITENEDEINDANTSANTFISKNKR